MGIPEQGVPGGIRDKHLFVELNRGDHEHLPQIVVADIHHDQPAERTGPVPVDRTYVADGDGARHPEASMPVRNLDLLPIRGVGGPNRIPAVAGAGGIGHGIRRDDMDAFDEGLHDEDVVH